MKQGPLLNFLKTVWKESKDRGGFIARRNCCRSPKKRNVDASTSQSRLSGGVIRTAGGGSTFGPRPSFLGTRLSIMISVLVGRVAHAGAFNYSLFFACGCTSSINHPSDSPNEETHPPGSSKAERSFDRPCTKVYEHFVAFTCALFILLDPF